MKNLKNTRAVTYRRPGMPAIILEGHWLTKKYRLSIGDQVDIDYQPKGIFLKKNVALSTQSQKRRKDKADFKKADQELLHDENEITSEGSTETREG